MISKSIWPEWREFPPLLPDKQKDDNMKKESKSLIWHYFIPAILFALGIIFIVLSKPVGDFLTNYAEIGWEHLLSECGIALIILSVLTLTVDKLLKERLISELKKDVFKATMGYLFPEEIRDEVKWFYNFPLLATRRDYFITIKRIDDQYVEVITSDNATIKNISNKPADIEPQLHADEWGVKDHPTELLELGYKHKDKRITDSDSKNKLINNTDVPGTIQWAFGRIKLASKNNDGDQIEIWRKLKETKGKNDNIWWVSIWPTVNPQIRIDAPDFDVRVGYIGRIERTQIEQYEKNAYRQPGTILPSQVLVVRWRPKEQNAEKEKTEMGRS